MYARTKLRATGIGGTIATAALTLWLVLPRERLLTDVGHQITTVPAEVEESIWLSNHELLMVYTDHPAWVTIKGSRITIDRWQGHAMVFDTVATKMSPQPVLSAQLNHSLDKKGGTSPHSFRVSPGGAWLVWDVGTWKEDRQPISYAARIDGTQHRQLERAQNENSFFIDDRHYVQVSESEPYLAIRSFETPKLDREYIKFEQANAELKRLAAQQPTFLAEPVLDDENHRVELRTYRTEDRLQKLYTDIRDYIGDPDPVSTVILKLPAGAQCDAAYISRQQNLICYHLVVTRTDPLAALLHRAVPQFPVQSRRTEALWVSGTDGSSFHEVGHVPVKPADAMKSDILSEIAWLPGSKQISFRNSGNLYVVPADK